MGRRRGAGGGEEGRGGVDGKSESDSESEDEAEVGDGKRSMVRDESEGAGSEMLEEGGRRGRLKQGILSIDDTFHYAARRYALISDRACEYSE